MSYWNKEQLNAITPPAIDDERTRGVLASLSGLEAEFEADQFARLRDPLTCAREALPALIAEYSAEEFIAPGLSEKATRRILSRIQELKALKASDEGVILGLSLLGMPAHIVQWYEESPHAEVGTFKVTLYLSEQLFESQGDSLFGPREHAAAQSMIAAMQRASQEPRLRVGLRLEMQDRAAITLSALNIHHVTLGEGSNYAQ